MYSSDSSSQIIVCEAPNILNFALFVQDIIGMDKCNTKYFPCQSLISNVEKIIESKSLATADKEWHEWWDNLLKWRYKDVNSNKGTLENDLSPTDDTIPYIDAYPILKQITKDWVQDAFWDWWNYPYAGGKMALEAVPALRSNIFALHLAQKSSARWFFDILYRQPYPSSRILIQEMLQYHYGAISPNDLWKLDWISEL